MKELLHLAVPQPSSSAEEVDPEVQKL